MHVGYSFNCLDVKIPFFAVKVWFDWSKIVPHEVITIKEQ